MRAQLTAQHGACGAGGGGGGPAPADIPVSPSSASMEMNESSRWTEEEMETAKKGEWRLAAGHGGPRLASGPKGPVVGRTQPPRAVTRGCGVVWGGDRLCF